jgi:hypothetical protein
MITRIPRKVSYPVVEVMKLGLRILGLGSREAGWAGRPLAPLQGRLQYLLGPRF